MHFTSHITSLAKSALLAALVAALPLAPAISAVEHSRIEAAAGPHSELGSLCVQMKATGWSVSGRLRLLPDPLRHSDPGQVVLEAVDPNGQILAASEATIYRVVTANPRERLFGFRGVLADEFPAKAVLRVRHLAAAR